LQGHENRIQELEQEKQFADDRISLLEANLRQRDEEVDQYTQRVVAGETEVEQLREEMSKLKREHSHVVSEQTRALQDAADQEEAARVRMEQFVRAKGEADVELKTNRDRVGALMDEVERLRRQVHTLQQDSADKDIKIVQITKQVSQYKEDILGLNMALESKQQELELV
jgi:chromosome segregation ATPase